MSLAEGVAARISYKAHSVGSITAGSEPTFSSDPGASSAQILRRTTCSLTLTKDTYQSAEVRSDRQIGDFRHGVKRVTGSVSGELSPATYWDFFEAAARGTAAAAITLGPSDLVSIAADNSASTITCGGGTPASLGLRVGDIIRFADLSESANNAKNFLITAIGGGSNRVLSVTPAPTTMTADTSFTLTTNGSTGQSLYVPASSHVSRKFAIERYNSDIDIAALFTECRVGGFRLGLPPTGMSTVEFPMMGRNQTNYENTNAPFFTSPSAATTTGIFAAVNGVLLVGGVAQGIVTGLDINFDMSPQSDPVVGSNLVPEIFLGRANITGQMTAFLEDATFLENFKDEDEVAILAYLTATTADNSPAMSIYMPRVKFGGADAPAQGEAGQTITLPYQALKYEGSGAGIETTTIRLVDTEAA